MSYILYSFLNYALIKERDGLDNFAIAWESPDHVLEVGPDEFLQIINQAAEPLTNKQ
jgi:hypothetical protein